jgi:hypothetical protein
MNVSKSEHHFVCCVTLLRAICCAAVDSALLTLMQNDQRAADPLSPSWTTNKVDLGLCCACRSFCMDENRRFSCKKGVVQNLESALCKNLGRKNERMRLNTRGSVLCSVAQNKYACDLRKRRELFGCLTRCNMPHKLLCE